MLCKTSTKKAAFLIFIYFSLNSSYSYNNLWDKVFCIIWTCLFLCAGGVSSCLSLKYLNHPALRKNNCKDVRCQADASFFIAALYFPRISLGSGTKAGQGTWPSISHMHSRRWYFLGPKVAGCDSSFLSLSSFSSVSLKKEICLLLSEAWMATFPLPALDPIYQTDGLTVLSLWTWPNSCQKCYFHLCTWQTFAGVVLWCMLDCTLAYEVLLTCFSPRFF